MTRALAPLLVLLTACADGPCPLDAAVAPGCGLKLGDESLRLGDSASEAREALGTPTERDLGTLGVRLEARDRGVVVQLDGPEGVVTALHVDGAHGGTTADGIGPGVPLDAVIAAWGPPVVDTLAETWWYRDAGVALEWQGDAVSTVVVFPPDP